MVNAALFAKKFRLLVGSVRSGDEVTVGQLTDLVEGTSIRPCREVAVVIRRAVGIAKSGGDDSTRGPLYFCIFAAQVYRAATAEDRQSWVASQPPVPRDVELPEVFVLSI